MMSVVEKEDYIAIRMDDGKVNAMSAAMLKGLTAQLEAPPSQTKPVLISGRKGIFSAGFDMPTFAQGPKATRDMVAAGVELILKVLSHPTPVVTLCTGHAYPMGAFILMSSDHAVGIEGPFHIGMNETAISIDVPDFALELARFRLAPRGLKSVPCARMFTPMEAEACGYIDALVPEEEASSAVEATLSTLSKLDMECFASTKARTNGPAIKAIRDAGLPERLTA